MRSGNYTQNMRNIRNIFNLFVRSFILPLLYATAKWAEYSASQVKSNLERAAIQSKSPEEIEAEKVYVNRSYFLHDVRALEFIIDNDNMLNSKAALKAIFEVINEDKTFQEFGDVKVLMIHAIHEKGEYSFHHFEDVAIDGSTTFHDYYKLVEDTIGNNRDEGSSKRWTL